MDWQMITQGMVMIDERRIIIMPNDMDDDCYRYMTELLMYADKEYPDEPVAIFCRGDGGDANVSEAVAGAIMEHGKCVGVLNGMAISGHANTFIYCQERVVLRFGALHFHTTFVSQMTGHMDYRFLLQAAHEMRAHDLVKARRLAELTDKDEKYWLERLERSGTPGFTMRFAEITGSGIAAPYEKPQSWLQKKIDSRNDGNIKTAEMKT